MLKKVISKSQACTASRQFSLIDISTSSRKLPLLYFSFYCTQLVGCSVYNTNREVYFLAWVK